MASISRTEAQSRSYGIANAKVKNIAKMLKAIHVQESKKASREKAAALVA